MCLSLEKKFVNLAKMFFSTLPTSCPLVAGIVTISIITFLKYLIEVAKEVVIKKDKNELKHRWEIDDYL